MTWKELKNQIEAMSETAQLQDVLLWTGAERPNPVFGKVVAHEHVYISETLGGLAPVTETELIESEIELGALDRIIKKGEHYLLY